MIASLIRSIFLIFVFIVVAGAGPQSTPDPYLKPIALDPSVQPLLDLISNETLLEDGKDPDTKGNEPSQNPSCCKICRKGKACGDSCIAEEKMCTRLEGCACDAHQ